ncbi:single-stranded DNA-binding protein 3-like isoform X14 [Branchiostoma lanceolatum]|uniref:single-stranded DNA-binding protein 3-like isoform X14 n=1 Tax=Branchiostoma lanceolatum TaxID=7740 RepID=UPI00345444D5
MYAKGKGSTVPSDNQAREKLALYVYEYLLHVGAQKAAQTFLSEIRWEKNITLGEPPGFLHSWWCVFWDLYCAAPERRDTCEHSSEAKAFHDYSAATAPSPLGPMPPNDGVMPGGPMPPGFFPGPFMNPRYPGGPRMPNRMPNQPPGGVPGAQPLLPNTMDPTRQQPQGHPSMPGPMQRMNHPRGMPMNPVSLPNYGGPVGMRPPPNSMGPGGLPPGMNMPPGGPGGRPWPGNPNTSTINYSSSSPGNYAGPPGGGPPGTPIMPSPQDSNSGDNVYAMMKNVPGGNMPTQFPMGTGPDGPMNMGDQVLSPVMNGESIRSPPINGSGDMDHIPKSSPNNPAGPGTPREAGEMGPGGTFGLPPFQDNVSDQNESAAILKIKESMQEEAKRFEKEASPGGPGHPEYFMQ